MKKSREADKEHDRCHQAAEREKPPAALVGGFGRCFWRFVGRVEGRGGRCFSVHGCSPSLVFIKRGVTGSRELIGLLPRRGSLQAKSVLREKGFHLVTRSPRLLGCCGVKNS